MIDGTVVKVLAQWGASRDTFTFDEAFYAITLDTIGARHLVLRRDVVVVRRVGVFDTPGECMETLGWWYSDWH